MRKLTSWISIHDKVYEEDFEVEDNATDAEIEELVQFRASQQIMINWGIKNDKN